jgi:hypothetical protein
MSLLEPILALAHDVVREPFGLGRQVQRPTAPRDFTEQYGVCSVTSHLACEIRGARNVTSEALARDVPRDAQFVQPGVPGGDHGSPDGERFVDRGGARLAHEDVACGAVFGHVLGETFDPGSFLPGRRLCSSFLKGQLLSVIATTCRGMPESSRAEIVPRGFPPTPSPPNATRQVKRSSSPKRCRASDSGGAVKNA